MAKYQGSILGTIKGRIGKDYVAYVWNTIRCVRAMPENYNDANSIKQQKTRIRLGVLSELSKMFATAAKIGFKKQAIGMTYANVFSTENKTNVTVSDQMEPGVAYGSVSVSKGSLDKSGNSLIASKTGTTVSIAWEEGTKAERQNDEVYCFARISEIADLVEEITRVTRSAKASQITLPVATDDPMTVYMFFRDPVTGNCSDSEAITIPA